MLAANLVTLAVVWWQGWPAHALLLVYWLETGVVIAVSAVKITRAEGTDDPEQIRTLMTFDGDPAESYVGEDNRAIADALVLEFVMDWLFVGFFFGVVGLTGEFDAATPVTVALATVSLVSYHVGSYWFKYVARRESERRGPVSLLVEPVPYFWGLVVVQIFGLGAVAITESAAGTVVVLLFIKTSADLLAHRRERKRALSE
nr:DUF6498-containing protein [Halosimplex salinum]